LLDYVKRSHKAGFKKDECGFLALYKLDGEPDIPCLCDVSEGIGGMKFSAIPRAEVGSRTVIDIDRGAYFPLEVKETPLSIRRAHGKPSRDFFSAYKNSSSVAIHRNSVDLANQELRHHGIYIDVEAMLLHSRFERGYDRRSINLTRSPH